MPLPLPTPGSAPGVGEYYKGFVKAKNVDDLLAKHSTQTVTTYGTRRSRRIGIPSVCSNSEAEEKENHQPMVSFYAQTLFAKFYSMCIQ